MIRYTYIAIILLLTLHAYNELYSYCYTIYNEKYFQKVSFCVITYPIGQNGRAVCKKHGNHGDARGAKCRAAGQPAIDHKFEYSSTRVRVRTSTALGPAGPRPRLQYS